ncbi:MAG: carbohydrate ABC transporter permease, partial [Halanaeroarchaeum sp.]
GLNNLPEQQIQAAELFGASRLQRFRYIALPYLKPVILIGVVLRAMGAIKMFDIIQLLTGGGPANSTQNISMYINELTFETFRIGYASTVAWVVFIVSVAVFSFLLRPLLYEVTETPDESAEEEVIGS